MARDILPTPILEGNDVIEFYHKLANFKENLEKKGITRESIREGAERFRALFKKEEKEDDKQK